MDIRVSRDKVLNRPPRKVLVPNRQDSNGKLMHYFGELTFDFKKEKSIPNSLKKELTESSHLHKPITKDQAQIVAEAVYAWAVSKGCTHFCHWFHPLTGSTAEKHDGFISFGDEGFIEKFGASELMQGEPDASSFPNGGSRTTFEARGYTAWDVSSPFFIIEGLNGSTLCIPTGFVAYHGDALDIKTPLIRSENSLSKEATKFLNLIGKTDIQYVQTCCGPEQEYFLVDRTFYYDRPDLVMTGRTLIGQGTAKNQQLDDHYFGSIPQRVKDFMDELNYELHRLGIPAKTQHNEVAPGQFEIAPIFEHSNIAADHNQIMMSTIDRVAERHGLKALLHEKPFPGINGSGKHLNWSMAASNGENLLSPSDKPHENTQFLAVCAIVIEAVHRHGDAIRMSIASHSNDHRLGANEAPPSIISVYLGEVLGSIFESLRKGETLTGAAKEVIDMGVGQLAHLLKDNTDRNRTSPFAFTGNRFEMRAAGSHCAIGLPLMTLNTAVAEVFSESNVIIEKLISEGKSASDACISLAQHWISSSHPVVFNGDNYSGDWVKEAAKRGLPNLRTCADALGVLRDKNAYEFLKKMNVLNESEIEMRHNAFLEKYNTCRRIEFESLKQLVYQYVIPSAISYKQELLNSINLSKEAGFSHNVESEICKRLSEVVDYLQASLKNLTNEESFLTHDEVAVSSKIANELMPISEKIAEYCNEIEEIVPADEWCLPTFMDMLFIR